MELRRLLYHKKTIVFILSLVLLQLAMLSYGFYHEKPEEPAMPASQHEKQVQDIMEECNRYLGISLFADTDSFAYKNVRQTKEDYSRILSVEQPDADTAFFDRLISFKGTNAVCIMIGIILALTYQDPESGGLKALTYSAKNGRGIRRLKQIFVLMIWSGIAVLILYGGSLLTGLLLIGSDGWKILGMPLQTLSLCRLFPIPVAVWEYLLLFLFFKWIILFELTAVIWFLFLLIGNLILASGAVVLLFLAEYIVWMAVGVTSSWNLLKYCNLWYHLSSNEYLYTYLNLNVGNHPVNRQWVILAAAFLLIFLLAVFSYLKGEYAKGDRVKWEISIVFPFWARMQERLNLLTAEIYKLLVIQKGCILILLFMAFVVMQSDFMHVSNTGYQEMYYTFMEQYQGLPTEESERYIRDLSKEVNAVTKEYDEADQRYAGGEISTDEYFSILMKYDTFYNERKFVSIVEQQRDYLLQLRDKKGIEGWYVNSFCYQSILEPVLSLKYGLFMIFILLTAFASVKVERDASMFRVLNGTVLGRKHLFYKKAAAVGLITAGMYLIMMIIGLASAVHVYGISAWNAPVQSLEPYYHVPLHISLLQGIILYYAGLLFLTILISVGFTLLFQRFRYDT